MLWIALLKSYLSVVAVLVGRFMNRLLYHLAVSALCSVYAAISAFWLLLARTVAHNANQFLKLAHCRPARTSGF
jgi:hypothetical protein